MLPAGNESGVRVNYTSFRHPDIVLSWIWTDLRIFIGTLRIFGILNYAALTGAQRFAIRADLKLHRYRKKLKHPSSMDIYP